MDEVGDEVDVLLDSGVRRGSDVVKAVALGAKAVTVGRPWVWGLAADGQAGIERAIEILVDEIDRTLMLIGVPTLGQLDRSAVRVPFDWLR